VGIISRSQGGSGSSTPQQLDYVEFTANVAIAATTVAGATVIVTGSSVVYDGATAVVVEFFCPNFVGPNSTVPTVFVGLFEDGAQLGVLAAVSSSAAVSYSQPMRALRRLTPSGAAHVYSVRAYGSAAIVGVTANAGNGGAASGNMLPGFIRITRAA
jgi:hypothetical protein